MNTIRKLILLLLAAACLLLAGTLRAQEDPGRGGQTGARPAVQDPTPKFTADEVRMYYYRPQGISLGDVNNTIRRIYGRPIQVEGLGGGRGGKIENLFFIGDTLVIYDTPAYAGKVLEAIRGMEAAFAEEKPVQKSQQFAVLEYSPRYLTLKSIQDALRPFTRQLQDPTTGGGFMNVAIAEERGLVIVRDAPERTREIEQLLERIDQPAPQVLLTCWVIRGTHEQADGRLPEELVKNLAQLLPYQAYALRAVGMVRTEVGANRGMSLSMAQDEDGVQYHLEIVSGPYNEKGKLLTLFKCEFARQGDGQRQRMFSTSTTVRGGEYAVLGVAGQEPLFVVLRFQPVM